MSSWSRRRAGLDRRTRRPRKISWGYVESRVIRAKLPLRALWLVRALKYRHQAGAHHARIYIGDVKLARIGRCSESSIYRAKKDVEQLHLVHVVHTPGGCTKNPDGKTVAAATGYEPHPDLYSDELPAEDRAARTPAPAAAAAAQRLRETWDRTREQIGSRAGP